jgi:predicted DNA-binding transcriptional regulator YafY
VRADRLLTLVMLLQSRGRMTARDLAERLEVSERTIYRDLDALSAAGVPVYAISGPGGGCAIDPAYRTSLTGLTADEARTLALTSSGGPLADLGLGGALDQVILKLLAGAPAAHRLDAEHARQRIYLDPDPWFQRPEPIPHLPLLQDAVWADERLRISYRRRDGATSERVIDPYGLVAKAGVWYLVTRTAGEPRVYRVSRILDAATTGERFARDPTFDLPTTWATWSTEFTESLPTFQSLLRVAPDRMDTLPAEVAALASPADSCGWRVVPMRFDIIEHAVGWVLSHGTTVEALEPPELRAVLAEAAVWLVGRYGESPHLPDPLSRCAGEGEQSATVTPSPIGLGEWAEG